MINKENANREFAEALKRLRLKYNLLQKQISEIADITQSIYSSYERGSTQMGLNDANNISRKVWGVGYREFVNFAKGDVTLNELPKKTINAIEESKKVKIKEQDGLLAQELDRLIGEGYLNSPITSKQLLSHMHPDLHGRNATEITNLLIKPPRNKDVITVGKNANENLFQLEGFSKK